MRLKDIEEFYRTSNDTILLEYLEKQDRGGFSSRDILEVIRSAQNPLEEWAELHDDHISEQENQVKIFTCRLFDKSVRKKNTRVLRKLKEFIDFKRQNPLELFGGSDRPYTGEFLKRAVPNLVMRHAHLTHDDSILYTIEGVDVKTIKLYGVFSHDDSGTGQPPNINRQQSLANKLSNQTDWTER